MVSIFLAEHGVPPAGTPKFSQIVSQMPSFTLWVSTFYVKLFKRVLYSISELIHTRFLMHLLLFN